MKKEVFEKISELNIMIDNALERRAPNFNFHALHSRLVPPPPRIVMLPAFAYPFSCKMKKLKIT